MLSTAWKIGTVGGTLEFMPAPAKGYDRSPTQIGDSHVSMGGATTKDVVAFKRSWSLPFTYLTDTEYQILVKYWDGTHGVGPFSFVDPHSGGGTFTVNVTGFTESMPLWGNHDVTMTLVEV